MDIEKELLNILDNFKKQQVGSILSDFAMIGLIAVIMNTLKKQDPSKQEGPKNDV